MLDKLCDKFEEVIYETVEHVGQLPDKTAQVVEDVSSWFVDLF